MSDAVNQAAQVLLPLVAVGANAAVEELSKEAGKELFGTARSVADRIRKFLRGPNPNETELAAALQCGLDEGLIGVDEVGAISRLYKNEGGGSQYNIEAHNALVNNEFHKRVDFH